MKVKAGDGLNIRQGAGITFNILGNIPYDSVVKITRCTSGGGYKWGLAEYNGIKGWIALDFTQKVTKTVNELALEVIMGLWGNGEDRKKRLQKAGYDYYAVQKRVEEIF